MKRLVLALGLENVLVPEIWREVARRCNVPELALTMEDRSNYEELMWYRIRLCRQCGIRLAGLREVVEEMSPLPGALDFLSWAKSKAEVVIVSDTFLDLAEPLLIQLGSPRFFCNELVKDEEGFISGFQLEQATGRGEVIRSLRQQGDWITAVGDSFNDLSMFKVVDRALLLNPPAGLKSKVTNGVVVKSLEQVKVELEKIWDSKLVKAYS